MNISKLCRQFPAQRVLESGYDIARSELSIIKSAIMVTISTMMTWAGTPTIKDGKNTALAFISSYFLAEDTNASATYVAKDAVFRDQKKGSIWKALNIPSKMRSALELKAIRFFDKQTIQYAIDSFFWEYRSRKAIWQHRHPTYIDPNLTDSSVGVIVYFSFEKRNKTVDSMLVLIFDIVGDSYKLVHLSDL